MFLNCQSNITWLEGTTGTPLSNNKSLDLGKRILDPRGVYSCNWTYKDIGISSLQVYYRSTCLPSPLGCNEWTLCMGNAPAGGDWGGVTLRMVEPDFVTLRVGERLTSGERAVRDLGA